MRTDAVKPANFDTLRENAGYPNKLYAYLHQNLIQDEIRVSSTALTAERISRSYYGFDQFRLYRTYPFIVQRGNTNQVFITGYGLNDVTVTTNRGDVTTAVTTATLSQLELAVTPLSSAALGDVQVTLTKPSGESLTTLLSVVDQRPFVPALDTVMLWHLDEPSNGAITVADAGALGLHGTADYYTTAAMGRFSGGRTATLDARPVYTANPFGALNFGANSFTLETWVKTPQVSNQKSLLQLYNDYYGEVGLLQIEASGALSARMFALNGTQWNVAVSRSYNPQTGFWQGRVDDNYWHHIALVLDRTENKLKIYVDGELRAETAKPANFDGLRDQPSYPTKLYAYLHQNLTQDEIRILDFPRTAQQISDKWLGINNGFGLRKSKPQNQIFGKASPPEFPPAPPNSKSILGVVVPKETRIEVQKEERK